MHLTDNVLGGGFWSSLAKEDMILGVQNKEWLKENKHRFTNN